MNTSSAPLALTMFSIALNTGPFLPSTTLLNSAKSNVAPWDSSSPALSANCVALNEPSVPSGISYNTLLLDLASVSSKSNTRIFLTGASGFLALVIALSALPKLLSISWLGTCSLNLIVLFSLLLLTPALGIDFNLAILFSKFWPSLAVIVPSNTFLSIWFWSNTVSTFTSLGFKATPSSSAIVWPVS